MEEEDKKGIADFTTTFIDNCSHQIKILNWNTLYNSNKDKNRKNKTQSKGGYVVKASRALLFLAQWFKASKAK